RQRHLTPGPRRPDRLGRIRPNPTESNRIHAARRFPVMKTKTTSRHRARTAHSGVLRYGVLASTCLGTLALATGAAQAFAGVGVASDGAHALANPSHRDVFSASFDVHQYGEVLAGSARNQAEAESIGCSD